MEFRMLLRWSFLIGITISSAHELRIYNACPGTVWAGILGSAGHPHLQNGGFSLNQCETRSFQANYGWQGSIWGRTFCDARTEHCLTGDCGNKIECNGAGGTPPLTLAEITLDIQGRDFYDISLVDGFNIPMSIEPIKGTFFKKDTSSKHECNTAGCKKDLNKMCPSELVSLAQNTNTVIGCNSACTKFNTDQYCCRGAYDSPQTCQPENWPKNSAGIFKKVCPDAYSYVYDDQSSTFTCQGRSAGITSYIITFCP